MAAAGPAWALCAAEVRIDVRMTNHAALAVGERTTSAHDQPCCARGRHWPTGSLLGRQSAEQRAQVRDALLDRLPGVVRALVLQRQVAAVAHFRQAGEHAGEIEDAL